MVLMLRHGSGDCGWAVGPSSVACTKCQVGIRLDVESLWPASALNWPGLQAEREVDIALAAGAIVIGLSHSHEFAYGCTGTSNRAGPCRNPHDPSRITGGSSAGAAAAVAAGVVPLAIGTDTAGSVRIPAALCGVVGFKPARNTLPHVIANGHRP